MAEALCHQSVGLSVSTQSLPVQASVLCVLPADEIFQFKRTSQSCVQYHCDQFKEPIIPESWWSLVSLCWIDIFLCRKLSKFSIKLSHLGIPQMTASWWGASQLGLLPPPHICLTFSFVSLSLIGSGSDGACEQGCYCTVEVHQKCPDRKKICFLQPLAPCQLWDSCFRHRLAQTVLIHHNISEFCSTKGSNVSPVNY